MEHEFSEIKNERRNYIENAEATYLSNPLDSYKLEGFLYHMIGSNKFATIFDFEKMDYSQIVNTDKLYSLLGYTEEDFTTGALNYDIDAKYKIPHEEDFPHKLRYNQIVYQLFTQKDFIFKSLDDHYRLEFRVNHKNGLDRCIVMRTCYIYEVNDEGLPLKHVDIWEVRRQPNDFDYVRPYFQTSHSGEIFQQFYKINEDILGIHFTDRQKQILELIVQRKADGEIGGILGISSRTVGKHLQDMKDRVNEFIELNSESKIEKDSYAIMRSVTQFKSQNGNRARVQSREDLRHFSRLYGLYPIPKIIAEN